MSHTYRTMRDQVANVTLFTGMAKHSESRSCENAGVILFVLGLIVGSVVASTATLMYSRRQSESTTRDLALLQARLRTLVRLAEAGFIRPDTVEAANVLNEVHDLVTVEGAHVVRSHVNVVASDDESDEYVPSVFR